jgi:hypothetical protein
MPRRVISESPSMYNKFVSCLTNFFNKMIPDKLSLKTITPKLRPKYVVSINTFTTLGKSVSLLVFTESIFRWMVFFEQPYFIDN